jgi:predicted RNase H-like nuclease
VLALGLDASRGKWLAVALEDGRFVEARYGPAGELVGLWPEAAAIGVDIPIGLPGEPGRECDRAARAFVDARRSSVFETFPRLVLQAPTYDQAREICVARGWRKPSIQSYGMRHRIFEIGRLARNDARIVEVHPEVSFRELAGHTLPSKRTAEGASARQRALGIALPDLPHPLDDVLDAAVVAYTAARYARGEALPLPTGHAARIGAIWR